MGKRAEARIYEKAFRDLSADIAIEIRDTLKYRSHWAGFEGSKTRRVNGTRVNGANRNIEDTGELISSMDLKLSQTGFFTNSKISFSAPHYEYVRFGTKKMAGRDFVKRGTDKALRHQSYEDALLERVSKFK